MIFPSIFWYVEVAYFASEHVDSNIESLLQVFHNKGVAVTVTDFTNFQFEQFTFFPTLKEYWPPVSGDLSLRDINNIWKQRNEKLLIIVRNYYGKTEIFAPVRNSTRITVTKKKFSLCNSSTKGKCLKIGNYKRKMSVLKGTAITVRVKKIDMVVEHNISKGQMVLLDKGYGTKLMKLAAEKLKFKWNCILETDDVTEKYDIATSGDRDLCRLNTYNFMEVEFVAVLRAPGNVDKATSLFEPFEWTVWVAIGVNFIVSGFALYGIINAQRSLREEKKSFSFSSVLFLLYLTFVNQDGNINSLPGRPTKFLISVWIFSSLILTWSYAGVILSSLAEPALAHVVSDYSELLEVARSRSHEIGMVINSDIHFWTLHKTLRRYYSLTFFPLKDNVGDSVVRSLDDGFTKVLKSNFILIIEKYTAWVYTKMLGENKFHMFRMPVDVYRVPFFIDFLSPYKFELLDVFNRMLKFGFDIKFKREEVSRLDVSTESAPETDDSPFKPLALKDLYLPFILLLIGYALSLIVLCLEKLYHAIVTKKWKKQSF